MSFAKEDWKRFGVLSGQLKVYDPAKGGDGVMCNASPGEWVAMCEYGEDNRIAHVAAMRDYLAERMDGEAVEVDGCVSESGEFDSDSGVVLIVDRKMDGKLPDSFKVPEHRLNKDIVDAYGRPDDDGKDDGDRFIESMFHMARDHGMPSLESVGYGAVCELGNGHIEVDLLYNAMRDVIGFEISRKRG